MLPQSDTMLHYMAQVMAATEFAPGIVQLDFETDAHFILDMFYIAGDPGSLNHLALS